MGRAWGGDRKRTALLRSQQAASASDLPRQNFDEVRILDRVNPFFEELPLIPHRQFHEVSFEELIADPVTQIRNVYEALDPPNFDGVEDPLQEYVDSLTGYKQNVFPELEHETRERIAREWHRCFDEWSHPT